MKQKFLQLNFLKAFTSLIAGKSERNLFTLRDSTVENLNNIFFKKTVFGDYSQISGVLRNIIDDFRKKSRFCKVTFSILGVSLLCDESNQAGNLTETLDSSSV